MRNLQVYDEKEFGKENVNELLKWEKLQRKWPNVKITKDLP